MSEAIGLTVLSMIAVGCGILFMSLGAHETFEREMETIKAHESLIFPPKGGRYRASRKRKGARRG